eukprot:366096-Chlamydomonas_euryale.AAC.7
MLRMRNRSVKSGARPQLRGLGGLSTKRARCQVPKGAAAASAPAAFAAQAHTAFHARAGYTALLHTLHRTAPHFTPHCSTLYTALLHTYTPAQRGVQPEHLLFHTYVAAAGCGPVHCEVARAAAKAACRGTQGGHRGTHRGRSGTEGRRRDTGGHRGGHTHGDTGRHRGDTHRRAEGDTH